MQAASCSNTVKLLLTSSSITSRPGICKYSAERKYKETVASALPWGAGHSERPSPAGQSFPGCKATAWKAAGGLCQSISSQS